MKALLFAVIALVSLVNIANGADAPKRNVLFIAVDDLRPELGCYGNKIVKSPNIDALAAAGLRFDRTYCQLALCNPSRASLLSGRRPESLGIFDLKSFVRDKNPDVVTLPELFKQNDYRALSFGKIFHTTNGNHEDPKSWSEKAWKPRTAAASASVKPQADNEDPHADESPTAAPQCADDELSDGKIASAAIAAMKDVSDKPFFLAVGFHKPHMPFVAPKKYWDLYDPQTIPLAPNPQPPKDAPAFAGNDSSELRRYQGVPKTGPIADDDARKLIHGYYACISYMDAQVGRVLAELDRLKLRDNTIIVLWGDHGYQLGEHGTWNKRTNWEIATRVPLIVSSPGQSTRGQATTALVELVDLYPTLAEMCGIALPDKLEGVSFTPLLAEPARPWKSAAFSVYQKRVPELGGIALGRAMRTERYRFIEWSVEGMPEKVVELYDEQTDPQENTNIAGLPENRQRVADLTNQLNAGWRAAQPGK